MCSARSLIGFRPFRSLGDGIRSRVTRSHCYSVFLSWQYVAECQGIIPAQGWAASGSVLLTPIITRRAMGISAEPENARGRVFSESDHLREGKAPAEPRRSACLSRDLAFLERKKGALPLMFPLGFFSALGYFEHKFAPINEFDEEESLNLAVSSLPRAGTFRGEMGNRNCRFRVRHHN